MSTRPVFLEDVLFSKWILHPSECTVSTLGSSTTQKDIDKLERIQWIAIMVAKGLTHVAI